MGFFFLILYNFTEQENFSIQFSLLALGFLPALLSVLFFLSLFFLFLHHAPLPPPFFCKHLFAGPDLATSLFAVV